MAKTALAIQTAVRTGLNPTYSAANGDGHAVLNTAQNVYLDVKNTHTGELTVTIQTNVILDSLTLPNRTVTVPATNGQRLIGPFPKAIYNKTEPDTAQANSVVITFSHVTNVTLAAIKVPDPSY